MLPLYGATQLKGKLAHSSANFTAGQDFSNFRLTVDRGEDLDLIRKLISKLGDDKNWLEYVKFLEAEPVLFDINAHHKRNEEFMQSSSIEKVVLRHITNFRKSDEYRSKIHDLIPGGAHTYSKGDDQFPQLSPSAIVRGSGSQVWDVDDNQYLDCSMGLTSVSLGHAYKKVLIRSVENY
jgi:spore coat polysaccharide biosynthesis protein SpsF